MSAQRLSTLSTNWGQRLTARKVGMWAIAWSALSTVILLQTSPWVTQTPGNDSGIFLYFGSEILKGKLPFVDLWDHKPPLVFYLNALGFWLGHGSRWGVWAVEVLLLSVASFCAFFFLRRFFRTWPAFLGVLGLLVNLAFVLEGGNLTEEYALPFQLAALYLFAREEDRPRPGWYGVWIGLLMGGAFLLKQTLVGVWAAMAIYLLSAALFTGRRRGLVVIAQMAGGFALPLLLSFAYFALRGALVAYWDVAFGFNFLYTHIATPERVSSLLDVLWFLNTTSGFFILAVMAWVGGIGYVLLHHEALLWQITRRWVGLLPLAGGLFLIYDGLFVSGLHMYAFAALSLYRWGLIIAGLLLILVSLAFFSGLSERRWYAWIKRYQGACDTPQLLPVYLAVIDLPVELAMISLSGRGYHHYFISMFPPLAILIAFLAAEFLGWVQAASLQTTARRIMPVVWSVVLFLPVMFGGVARTIEKIHPGTDLQSTLTVNYVSQHTRREDTVLFWGTQTGLYYLSDRESPTRFVHQIPLLTPQYATPERIGEYLRDIQVKKPALIIDTRLDSFPLPYQAGDPSACARTDRPHQPGMETVYAYICANYQPVETIGPDSWIIYRYNPAVPSASH